jgi:hypothetical protein
LSFQSAGAKPRKSGGEVPIARIASQWEGRRRVLLGGPEPDDLTESTLTGEHPCDPKFSPEQSDDCTFRPWLAGKDFERVRNLDLLNRLDRALCQLNALFPAEQLQEHDHALMRTQSRE